LELTRLVWSGHPPGGFVGLFVQVVSTPCPTTPLYGFPRAAAAARSFAAARDAAARVAPLVGTLPVGDRAPSSSAVCAALVAFKTCPTSSSAAALGTRKRTGPPKGTTMPIFTVPGGVGVYKFSRTSATKSLN